MMCVICPATAAYLHAILHNYYGSGGGVPQMLLGIANAGSIILLSRFLKGRRIGKNSIHVYHLSDCPQQHFTTKQTQQ